LVLLSTLLSPISTPLALAAAGAFSPGEAGPLLTQLAEAGDAGMFLTLWVVVPMVLGFLTRLAVGESRADAAAVLMKLMTAAILLGLCYVNASACLPGVAADPDWDFLGLVAVVVVLMCGTGFAAGFGVARVVAADPARRAALVFGIGMANNGAGLSLGAGVLAGCPMALLPVVVVNLVQHVAAGWANARLGRDHVSQLNTRGGEPGPPRR
jgi:BASS family bile acid:Na+ symporter